MNELHSNRNIVALMFQLLSYKGRVATKPFGVLKRFKPSHTVYSRVIFKAQWKVGWQPKYMYHIKCYIPKCLSYSEVYESARNQWPLLVRAEKSKIASRMAAKNKCIGVLYMIRCTDLMYISTSY